MYSPVVYLICIGYIVDSCKQFGHGYYKGYVTGGKDYNNITKRMYS